MGYHRHKSHNPSFTGFKVQVIGSIDRQTHVSTEMPRNNVPYKSKFAKERNKVTRLRTGKIQ